MYKAKVTRDEATGKWTSTHYLDIVADPVAAATSEGFALLGLIMLYMEDRNYAKVMETVDEGFNNLEEIRRIHRQLSGN